MFETSFPEPFPAPTERMPSLLARYEADRGSLERCFAAP